MYHTTLTATTFNGVQLEKRKFNGVSAWDMKEDIRDAYADITAKHGACYIFDNSRVKE